MNRRQLQGGRALVAAVGMCGFVLAALEGTAFAETPATVAAPLPSASTKASATPAPVSKGAGTFLAASERWRSERILEAKVLFVARGEGGRLAALADDAGDVIPWRFENGAWQKLPLPEAHRAKVGASALGMYFGRDNRPRMIGYRDTSKGARMVYLRFRDGAWQDMRREIGSLASETSVLFGELGEADPEIVCKDGGDTILKSRKGWTVLHRSPPKDAVIRGFFGHGYALYGDGLYRGEPKGFVRVGAPGPWTTTPSGFWVGPDGAALVAEPGKDALHVLDPATGAWRTEASPIRGPRDVAGPTGDRFIVGDGGIAHVGAQGARRVGDSTWTVTRVHVIDDHAVAAGPNGVFLLHLR